MKRDITELITKATVVPSRLRNIEKLMKYKDKELYTNNKKRGDKKMENQKNKEVQMLANNTLVEYIKKKKRLEIVSKKILQVESRIEILKLNLKDIEKASCIDNADIKGVDYESFSESTTPTFTKDAGFVNSICDIEQDFKKELISCYKEKEVLDKQLYELKMEMIVVEHSIEELEEEEKQIIKLYYENKIKKKLIAERYNYNESTISRKIKRIHEKIVEFLEYNIELVKNKLVNESA